MTETTMQPHGTTQAADAAGASVGHRRATVVRATNETQVEVTIDLDGTGCTQVDTGVPFFDHMLDAFGRHGLFDLEVKAVGDTQVDDHHTVEDVGIVLGQAIAQASGDKCGIARFASQAVPMDETLVLSAVDVSGRGQFHGRLDLPFGKVGTFDTQLPEEFFIALAANAGIALHVRRMAGANVHHLIEAAFKAAGITIGKAFALDPRRAGTLPSTKGVL